MDMASIGSLIGSLGFPIVCCVALFWYMVKSNEKHKEEMDKMAEAINNNTKVMTELLAEIKRGE